MLHLHEENSIAQLLCDIYNLIKIVLKNKPDSTERKNKGDEFQSSSNETTLVSGKTCGSELEEALPVVQGEGTKAIVSPWWYAMWRTCISTSFSK